MTIPKAKIYPIVIISWIISLPFLIFTGLLFIGNVFDLQFGSDLFLEGGSLILLLIPLISLVILIKSKEDTKNYTKISLAIFVLNFLLLVLGIFGLIYFIFINPFSM